MSEDRAGAPWWRRPFDGDTAVVVMMAVWVGLALPWTKSLFTMSAGTLWAQHLSASFLTHPLGVLFLPGGSPAIAMSYAPFAAAGRVAFQLAHVVSIPLTMLLAARLAVARGIPMPNLAALIAFGSPALLAGGVAAVPGADAALVVALALYAIDVRNSPRLGGLLLGLLGLIRPELVIVSIGIAVARRDKVLMAFAISLPAAHAAVGALVGGVEWLVAHLTTPALDGPAPTVGWASAATEAIAAVVAVAPAIGLLPFSRLHALGARDRADGVVGLLFIASVITLGTLDVGSVGLGPERLLPALPLMLPALTRSLGQLIRGDEWTWGIVVFAVVAIAITLLPDGVEWQPGVVVAAWAALVALIRAWRASAPVVVVIFGAAGILLTPSTQLITFDQAPDLPPVLTHLEESPRSTGRIVTDVPLLRTLAEVRPEVTPESVSFLWSGRVARPLEIGGRLPDGLDWLLRDHPFGAPLFEPDPEALRENDMAVIVRQELWPAYEEDARLSLVFDRPAIRIYQPSLLSPP